MSTSRWPPISSAPAQPRPLTQPISHPEPPPAAAALVHNDKLQPVMRVVVVAVVVHLVGVAELQVVEVPELVLKERPCAVVGGGAASAA